MKQQKIVGSNIVSLESYQIKKEDNIAMTLNTQNNLATQFLMERLIELYPKPIVATVRELISNAYDAVSKQDYKEIKITRPTEISQNFVVEDNGVGMSRKEIVEIYSKFGASTKGEDLDSIGAYGLGAKAPLSYCNSFIVTTIKDGFETSLLVSKEEMGNYIKVISHKETNKHSGTKVTIPILKNDIEEFNQIINLYENNPVSILDLKFYINNKLITNDDFYILENFFQISEDLYTDVFIKKDILPHLIKYSFREHEIESRLGHLIGGYSYSESKSYYNSTKTCIFVSLPIGVVDFTSSRDDIKINDRYNIYKNKVKDFFQSEEIAIEVFKKIRAQDDDFIRGFWQELYDSKCIIHSSKNGQFLKVFLYENKNCIKHPTIYGKELTKLYMEHKKIIGTIKSNKSNSILFCTYKDANDYDSYNSMIEERDIEIDNFPKTRLIREINEKIANMDNLKDKDDSHYLFNLMTSVFHSLSPSIIVIHMKGCSDIEINKLIKSRAKIFDYCNEKHKTNRYIYTIYSEEEFKDLYSDYNLAKPEFIHYKAEDIIEISKKVNRERKEKTTNHNSSYSFKLYRVDKEKPISHSIPSSIEDLKKNDLILVQKKLNSYNFYCDFSKSEHYELLKEAYAHSKNIDSDSFDIYVCTGRMLVEDIKKVIDIGCIIKEGSDWSLSNSNIYKEHLIKNQDISLKFHNTISENCQTSENILKRLLLDISNRNRLYNINSYSYNSLEWFELLKLWSKSAKYRFNELENIKTREDIYNTKILSPLLISTISYDIELRYEERKELISKLNKTDKEKLEIYSCLFEKRFYGIYDKNISSPNIPIIQINEFIKAKGNSEKIAKRIIETNFEDEEKYAKTIKVPYERWNIQNYRKQLKYCVDKVIELHNFMKEELLI